MFQLLLGETGCQSGYQHRGTESEDCFKFGGSGWINLYQCPGEDVRLVGRQWSRPSKCYSGCRGGYICSYPEEGNPVYNQILVCVRRKCVFILGTGSDSNTVSALECTRHCGQLWTPGKEAWIRLADGSFMLVEVRSQRILCYQGAAVELGTGLVSGELPSLLGKGIFVLLYGESQCGGGRHHTKNYSERGRTFCVWDSGEMGSCVRCLAVRHILRVRCVAVSSVVVLEGL